MALDRRFGARDPLTPPAPGWRRWWGWARAAVPFVGLVGAIFVLSWTVDFAAAGAALVSAEPRWLAACAGLALTATVIVGFKLWAVVRIVGVRRSFRETWSAVVAGLTLNAVLPGRGGDLVRAVFLSRDPKTLPVLLGAVLYERIVDVGTLGGLVLLTGIQYDVVTFVAFAVVAASVGGGGLLAILGPRSPIRPDLGERLSRAAALAIQRPFWSGTAIVLSLLAWLNNALLMVCALHAVGSPVPVLDGVRAASIGIMAGIVPVTISGIGTRDAAFIWALGGSVPSEQAAAAGLLYTAFIYWFLALLGTLALGSQTLRAVRTQVRAGGKEPQDTIDSGTDETVS